jgi:Ca-activated chloride channel family protein
MIFERPDFVFLAPVAVLLVTVALLAQWRRAVRLSRAYGGPAAARRLTGRRLGRFPAARSACLGLAVVSLVAAAAGVGTDPGETPPPPTPVDLIIAVDVSQSMSGADVAPSRIGRARDAVQSILDADVADRVALDLFAEWPYGLVPLTEDDAVVAFFAPFVAPELVALRDQGTSLEAVVAHAAESWAQRPRSDATAIVLLVSDGEVHGPDAAVLDTVAAVAGAGLQVWTAGVGTDAGAPLFVPGSDGAPLLDDLGSPVVAGYGEALLREIAERGDGRFHDIGDDGGVRDLISALRGVRGEAETPGDAPVDFTSYLIVAGLLLLMADAVLDGGRFAGRAARRIP